MMRQFVEALHRYHFIYGAGLKVRVEVGDTYGMYLDLDELAYEIKSRLVSAFLNPGDSGAPKYHRSHSSNNVILARNRSQGTDLCERGNVELVRKAGEQRGRPFNGDERLFNEDPHWKDLVLFHEYFHGDTGRGLGASHQTGWTGCIAKILQGSGDWEAKSFRY